MVEITTGNKLVALNSVWCYGISRDPETKNYVMVMKYMKKGNLRQYLQNKNNELSFYGKLWKLKDIANGLDCVHQQNLVHRDLHSGNILNNTDWDTSIADFGLSRPVNFQKEEEGGIFGVLPYVAPEVLQGQPYTQKSDVYSFGIITYELLANEYPYPEMDDNDLIVGVCFGKLRPNMDKIPIPQLLKDLIKKCWDADPKNRPSAEKLLGIISSWREEIRDNKDTEFTRQYLTIWAEYDHSSKNIPYQIYPMAITTSKPINTKLIIEQLKNYQGSQNISVDIPNELTIKTEQGETSPLINNSAGSIRHPKRQLSLGSQSQNNQGESKFVNKVFFFVYDFCWGINVDNEFKYSRSVCSVANCSEWLIWLTSFSPTFVEVDLVPLFWKHFLRVADKKWY